MSNDLAMSRAFAAAPQIVFDAFLAMHGDERPGWIVASELDLRPGGTWIVTFKPPGLTRFREERTLTEVRPPHSLAYQMRTIFDGKPGFVTAVEMTFAVQGTGTRLSLVQRGFPTPEARDDFAGGWPGVFDELDTWVQEAGKR